MAAEILDHAFQLSEALEQFQLTFTRELFGRGVRIFGPGAARSAARWRKDAGHHGAAAIGARHVLIAADLAGAVRREPTKGKKKGGRAEYTPFAGGTSHNCAD